MTTYTAISDGTQRYHNRNAWQARLRIDRDGEYFQFVSVGVSGRGLMAIDASSPPESFMSTLARASKMRVEEAILEKAIPLVDPTMAYELWFDEVSTVVECHRDPGPALEPGDVAWSFSLV